MNWMAFDTNSILIQCANPVCFRKFSIKIWKKKTHVNVDAQKTYEAWG